MIVERKCLPQWGGKCAASLDPQLHCTVHQPVYYVQNIRSTSGFIPRKSNFSPEAWCLWRPCNIMLTTTEIYCSVPITSLDRSELYAYCRLVIRKWRVTARCQLTAQPAQQWAAWTEVRRMTQLRLMELLILFDSDLPTVLYRAGRPGGARAWPELQPALQPQPQPILTTSTDGNWL